jgi:hypothetical protein
LMMPVRSLQARKCRAQDVISGLFAVVLTKHRKADTYAADQEFRVFE